MEYEEPIFKKIMNSLYDELDDKTIQDWINKSQEYHERDQVATGMHVSRDCNDTDTDCCSMCGNGHEIVSAVQERDTGNVTSQLNCTNPNCQGSPL